MNTFQPYTNNTGPSVCLYCQFFPVPSSSSLCPPSVPPPRMTCGALVVSRCVGQATFHTCLPFTPVIVACTYPPILLVSIPLTWNVLRALILFFPYISSRLFFVKGSVKVTQINNNKSGNNNGNSNNSSSSSYSTPLPSTLTLHSSVVCQSINVIYCILSCLGQVNVDLYVHFGPQHH